MMARADEAASQLETFTDKKPGWDTSEWPSQCRDIATSALRRKHSREDGGDQGSDDSSDQGSDGSDGSDGSPALSPIGTPSMSRVTSLGSVGSVGSVGGVRWADESGDLGWNL